MTQDRIERHVMFASIFLLILFVGLTLFVSSIARANPASRQRGQQCDVPREMRHVPRLQTEAGSAVGKSMNVPRPSLTGSPEAARCATRSNHF